MRFKPVAVLYQAFPPPPIEGIVKPFKPGGYRDSGADIAHALKSQGVDLITPVSQPRPEYQDDWVFADNEPGINEAVALGAEVLWLNTTLYRNHPIRSLMNRIAVVGQDPAQVDQFENKWVMHQWLTDKGYLVPAAEIVRGFSHETRKLVARFVDRYRVVIVKPVRGRGSQGVFKCHGLDEVWRRLSHWDRGGLGEAVLIEQYLPGTEVTIAVLPPGCYRHQSGLHMADRHWCLPAVFREGHQEGIVPYSGIVPVTANSWLGAITSAPLEALNDECAAIGTGLGTRAPLRIDARADQMGQYRIIDVNFKPNLTGPGRPNRDNQASLVTIAAQGVGWDYRLLIENLSRQWWTPVSEQMNDDICREG